ncbi:pro-sigmaK processing inhibitor BofA family protein [Paenibacillus aurantius]|uniref:Pro-sigmaK processing inhibitor BofA family protein n=1 Tax=Paenibacillus aurantius TaxID=2918900 RepID=A0AA96RF99_9BACL|nr:pro-sigmaK processing inhibitor BofA family protein [Paenibacillus aurantius]WNQ11038.1 pro-sigmaK processing inhibitor BofA family protein [Paenibacillus aurantius]
MLKWGIFLGSVLLLFYVVLRNRGSLHWLTYLGLNAAISALLLYFANWFGAAYEFHIPINGSTVGTIGVLGVPGLALIAAVKLIVLT